jgi:hypothetical protein
LLDLIAKKPNRSLICCESRLGLEEEAANYVVSPMDSEKIGGKDETSGGVLIENANPYGANVARLSDLFSRF